MRLWIVSDLHQDFSPYDWGPPPAHDVLVVAGDAMERLDRSLEWIRDTAPTSAPIVYVPGNHDAWRTRWPRDLTPARDLASNLGIALLAEGEAVEIGGVRFIGATLWTDFALAPGAEALSMSEYDHGGFLDGRRITASRNGYRRWLAREAQRTHREHRRAIQDELARPHEGPTVVVTHHAPHPLSLPAGKWNEWSDATYASDLTELMTGPTAPDLWVHGHVHVSRDYAVGGTRVVANPRGYAAENSAFVPGLVVDL